MADESYPQDDASADTDDETTSRTVVPTGSDRAPWHAVALSLIRAGISLLIVVWIYLNFDPDLAKNQGSGLVFMTLGLVAFIAWTAWQGKRIVHAKYPALRAVETLATVIPLFLIVFASTYVTASQQNPGAFNEPLSKGSAIYFTIVVLSTTGFGDIVPRSGFARAAVNIQMIIDLFFVALTLRFILASVNKGREQRAQGVPPRTPKTIRKRSSSASASE